MSDPYDSMERWVVYVESQESALLGQSEQVCRELSLSLGMSFRFVDLDKREWYTQDFRAGRATLFLKNSKVCRVEAG